MLLVVPDSDNRTTAIESAGLRLRSTGEARVRRGGGGAAVSPVRVRAWGVFWARAGCRTRKTSDESSLAIAAARTDWPACLLALCHVSGALQPTPFRLRAVDSHPPLQQNAAELCTLLVSEVYGEVSAVLHSLPVPSPFWLSVYVWSDVVVVRQKVVALLCQFGRLSLVDLKRHSKLPERILKQTLVVLVQQHLVVHYTFHEGNRDVTYYDCAWEQAYQLVHSGRIIRTAEERYGDNGAMIVSNMLELGHARVSDFLAAYGKVEKKSRGKEAEKTNGNAAPEVMSVGTLRELMGKMLEDRFLIQVHKHHMHPITDTENAMRKEVHELLHTQIKTAAKLAKEVDLRVLERMQAMKDGDADPHAGMTKVTGKRKASSSGGRSKKKNKVSEYDMGDGLDDIQWEINVGDLY